MHMHERQTTGSPHAVMEFSVIWSDKVGVPRGIVELCQNVFGAIDEERPATPLCNLRRDWQHPIVQHPQHMRSVHLRLESRYQRIIRKQSSRKIESIETGSRNQSIGTDA